MRTLTLTLPSSLEWPDRDIQLLVAAKLFEAGVLSLGQAAETVGLSRRAFSEIIGRFGVSILNYESDQIAEDLKNAEAYTR